MNLTRRQVLKLAPAAVVGAMVPAGIAAAPARGVDVGNLDVMLVLRDRLTPAIRDVTNQIDRLVIANVHVSRSLRNFGRLAERSNAPGC